MNELLKLFLIAIFFFFSFFNLVEVSHNKNQNKYQQNIYTLIFFLFTVLISSFLKNGFEVIFFFLILIFFVNIFFNISKIKNNLLFVFFAILIIFGLFITLAAEVELGWDGQSYWYPKAYHFANSGDIFTLSNIRATHPHLGPYIWGFFWNFFSYQYEYLGRLFLVFFYIFSIIFIVFNNLKLSYQNLFSFFIIFTLTCDINLFKGYQEYYLFSFFLLFTYLYNNSPNEKHFFLLNILILNLLLWTKNESMVLSLPLIILSFFYKGKSFIKLKILYLVSILLIYLIKIYVSSNFININLNYNLSKINFELLNFHTLQEDILLFSYYLFLSFFKNPIWLLFFYCIIFSKLFKLHRHIYFQNYLLFCLNMLFIIFIYHLIETPLLNWSLSGSLDRLMFSISGYFVYYIDLNLKKIFQNKND